MGHLFDVRATEDRGTIVGFAALLMAILGGHTILETARDALLLTGPGPRVLGLVYMVIAIGTLPGAAFVSWAGQRFGQRQALAASLSISVVGPLVLYASPQSHATAIATYVMTGIFGSVVVPQFWTLVGTVLTVAQGKRLFGLIGAGGIVGAVVGPAIASGVLVYFPVKSLLLCGSAVFALAVVVVSAVRLTEAAADSVPIRRSSIFDSIRAVRSQPFLVRVALVVFLSTAALLAIDYLFKSTVGRALPRADVAPFVAHYYLALNCLSLVVQLLASGRLIRRLGVVPGLLLTPALLLGGAVLAFASGSLPSVLLVKGIDGSLRFSMHRVTAELMYLPIPLKERRAAKPFIDGTLARAAQTLTGAGLLALAGTSFVAPRPLSIVVVGLTGAWLLTVLTMRRPYLQLLRSAVTSGALDAAGPEPIDLETSQLLVQRLASEDPHQVEWALTVLARRGREGFVSALVLMHEDEGILLQALEMFGASSRTDWYARARKLLGDPRESVRIAAARALARHEQLDASSLADDAGWRARGYAAVRMALRDASTQVAEHASIAALLEASGDGRAASRLGMLAAIADAAPTGRLSPLLRRLASEGRVSPEHTALLAQAAAHQGDTSVVPKLVELLAFREGREAVRAALVTLGEPALSEVRRVLRDATRDRRLRLHVPKTLAGFGSRRAADWLLEQITVERDGLVRYKCIQALRRLVSERRIFVDRKRVERLCVSELERHFRRLALRHVIALSAESHPLLATELLLELLDEKAASALMRAFHLLQIAHPRQGVHHAFLAWRSHDPYARANGAELIDALLRRRDQTRLRALFRVATDDLDLADRIERARGLGLPAVQSRDEAVEALVGGRDPMLAALGARLRSAGEPGPEAEVIPISGAR